jgi:hypothetical protein
MGSAALALAVTDLLVAAVELEWHAPEGCPDGAWVSSCLARYLGGAPRWWSTATRSSTASSLVPRYFIEL